MNTRHIVRDATCAAAAWLALALIVGACNGTDEATGTPPTADAGDDQAVTVGDVVTLDGSASSDPDGDSLSFAWELQEAPSDSSATLQDADTQAPSFTADAAGEYVATLTVSDGELEASDTVTVTASGEANEAPILSSIDDQRTPMNEPIEVSFAVTDEDPEGVAIEASSDDPSLVGDGDMDVLGSGSERGLRVTPAPFGLGEVTINLTARDAGGLESSQTFRLAVTRAFQTQFPKLTANDGADDDRFGRSVAISGDLAVIGAPLADDDGIDSGSAYVFRRDGEAWSRSATLPPEPPVVQPTANAVSAGDEFGHAVAIDGEYVIIGAPYADEAAEDAGAAFVYERCVSTTVVCQQPWSAVGTLTASDAAEGDRFGSSVAISGDHALIGAPDAGEGASSALSGAAYVFQRSEGGWNETAKLTHDGGERDRFGWSVAIRGDHAIIGAIFDSDEGSEAGTAFAFQRSGDAWLQTARLTASDASAGDYFGWSVAMRGDHALVGAPSPYDDDTPDTGVGAAYVFQRSGDAWNRAGTLTSDVPLGSEFGHSVAIDGTFALVGARLADGSVDASGAAYVFQRSGNDWRETVKLTASDAAPGDQFGWSVALSGDHALIGAPWDEEDGIETGSAYSYLK